MLMDNVLDLELRLQSANPKWEDGEEYIDNLLEELNFSLKPMLQ